MNGRSAWTFALLVLISAQAGCAYLPLGPWGGPAYDLDLGKIGTGEPAIVPRNDPAYLFGEPMDCRTRKQP